MKPAIYVHFDKGHPAGPVASSAEAVMAWLQALKRHVDDKLKENVIGIEAYADFERLPEDVQGDLYLLGADTHNVLGTDHKNAADMKLCIDTMEILYTRPNIGSFILAAGDRDYIPLIRHLRKQGKSVRVAGFPGTVAGDLLTTVGSDNFLDGRMFLPAPNPVEVRASAPAAPKALKPAAQAPASLVAESASAITPGDNDRVALKTILKHFAGKKEVWMTPYLHKLRSELPELAEFERRELVRRLEQLGVVEVVKRLGQPNPFSVLVVNWNHPLVHEVNPGK